VSIERVKFYWKQTEAEFIHVNSATKGAGKKLSNREIRSAALARGSLVWLGVCVLLCGFSSVARAQSKQPEAESEQSAGHDGAAPTREEQADQQSGLQNDERAQQEAGRQTQQVDQESAGHQVQGSISGSVVDQTGAVVAGAVVTLIRGNQSSDQRVTGADGQFSFANVAPGPFQFTIIAAGLAPETVSGVLQPGDDYVAEQIALHVAGTFTAVRVEPPPVEIAETQIKNQEKQRVLAVVPNFYVSYVPDAVPLTPKQKFELAWRTVIDPMTFSISGVVAGVQQAENQFSGYGQGAQGYGKRFGAAYGDIVTGTFIGSAILPSILKQDPRYFYKGTGSKRSRLLYAIANAVICKGDNHEWQLNYSNIAGSLAAGGISNSYYPKDAQNRVGLVFENTAIKIGETAVLDVFQEFLIRKLTPKSANRNPAKS
jgi:hypothetical protein